MPPNDVTDITFAGNLFQSLTVLGKGVGIGSICYSLLEELGWSSGAGVADSQVPTSEYVHKAVLNSIQHVESFVSASDFKWLPVEVVKHLGH